jgi:G:T-mismatch repair DNA endonuclease (very short patch repair protein)
MTTLGKHWTHTSEYKHKIAEIKRQQYREGLTVHNKGRTKDDYLPLETVSSKLKGRLRSPEHCRKISVKAKARMATEYYKAASRRGAYASRAKHLFRSTKLEQRVDAILRELSIGYEAQFVIRDTAGRYLTIADFYLADGKLCIYVNGCYWHNCQTCGYPYDEWRHSKDARVPAILQESNLSMLVLWEHESIDEMRSKITESSKGCV